jgi:hypothetical protein
MASRSITGDAEIATTDSIRAPAARIPPFTDRGATACANFDYAVAETTADGQRITTMVSARPPRADYEIKSNMQLDCINDWR